MSVIGEDGRQAVGNIGAFPYNQVVYIWIDLNADGIDGAGDETGSGFLISPNHVLTAAHVAPSTTALGLVHVQVGHGIDAGGHPASSASVGITNRDFFRSYNSSDPTTDVVILTLASPVAFGTQSVGLSAFAPGATMNGLPVTVAGYPGDLPAPFPDPLSGHVMYSDSGTLTNTNPTTGHIEYTPDLDTGAGQSGSGVWGYNSDAGANLLYGVHTNGQDSNFSFNGGNALLWDNWDEITARLTANLTPAAIKTLSQTLPVSVLIGSNNSDNFTFGSALREILFGYGGNDTAQLGLGNDMFNGGPGTDTLSLGAVARSILTFGNSNDAFVFDRADNSFDRLVSVEQIQNGATTTSLASGQNINTYTSLGGLNSSGITNQTVAEAIFGLHAGIQLDSTSLVATSSSASFFGGLNYGSIHMGPGLLLTTGNGTPHQTGFESVSLGLGGNTQLDSVIQAAFPSAGASHDANTLQFTFTITSDKIHSVDLSVVFASEEYPEFSNSSYVDIAAVIVNGKNYALFNANAAHPLSILDANINAGNFINNDGNGALPIAYDGVSSVLSISAPVHLGQNTILIGVEDTGDSIYDSALFLTDLTFRATQISGLFLNLTSTINNLIQNILNYFNEESNILIDLGPGDDSIVSGTGSDVITGGAGNDTMNGGLGIDTAVFSGLRSAYTVAPLGSGTSISGPDGTDILTSVEKLAFDDLILSRPATDFDGGFASDILWQNNNGQAHIWSMNGTTIVSQLNAGGNPGPTWHEKGAGDFNTDGRADILWQNDSGQAAIWLMNGNSPTSQAIVGGNPGPTWHIKAAGDFNGDGNADILWQNDNGQADIWLMNGTTAAPGVFVGGNPGPSWHIMAAGDFDGDGNADILWQNDNGQADIWLMNGTTAAPGVFVGGNPGPTWHIKAAGDFNDDGKADILWQNDNGQADIWLMNGTTPAPGVFVGGNPGPSWHIKDAADFNGDGKADILWQNDNGQADIWLMDGVTTPGGVVVGGNPGAEWHVIA